jgi:hypothetical protein
LSNHENLYRNRNRKKDSVRPRTTRQEVIKVGLEYLSGAGADHICKVCIPSGGSCCKDCRFLKNGVGCQQRNTSCTAWLCGFLKYIFYEAGIISEWNTFWDQIPGQDFRRDFTPSNFDVQKWIVSPSIRYLAEAFAKDLQDLTQKHYQLWIIEIKETLDRYVDQLLECRDPQHSLKLVKQLNYATKDFHRFHQAKEKLKQKPLLPTTS